MTNRAFLLLGFLIFLLISIVPARAETIPSTYTPPSGSSGSSGYASEIPSGYTCGGGLFTTKQSACNNCNGTYNSARTLGAESVFTTENTVPIYQTECRQSGLYGQVRPSATGTCPAGMVSSGTWTCSGSCPAGQSLVNGVCTAGTYSCPAGYIISADQQTCTKIQCPAGDIASKGVYYGQTVTSPACINGCATTYSGQQPWDSASGWIYIGQYKNTGQTCAEATEPPSSDVPTPTAPESTDPPTTAEYDCVSKGMSYGSVNGVIVCVPSGTPNTPPMVEPPQTTTKENPDGTTTETQTQDSQNGTNITRNTTVIVRDAQGNIVSEETSSVTATQAAFCEENPNSSVCAESKTSGGGNCDTPPSSEGDAIQAAILKQTWETRCESKKTNSALGEGSALAASLAMVGETAMTGEPTDLSTFTETVDVSGQISQEKFLTGGCIPDKVITGLPMGGTVTIPFSAICPYIEYFGMAMIALAMLGAARITGIF